MVLFFKELKELLKDEIGKSLLGIFILQVILVLLESKRGEITHTTIQEILVVPVCLIGCAIIKAIIKKKNTELN